jgi:hypothetical protein
MLKQAWTSSKGSNPLKMVNLNPKWQKRVTIKKHDEIALKMVQIDSKID